MGDSHQGAGFRQRLLFLVALSISFQAFAHRAEAFTGEARRGDISNSLCLQEAIGESELLQHTLLDVDGDRSPDDIALYLSDDTGLMSVSLTVVSETTVGVCRLIHDEELAIIERVNAEGVNDVTGDELIELVDLTGDGRPELHVAFDEESPYARSSRAHHFIFLSDDGKLERVFSSGDCLYFNRFEFREAPDGGTIDIYREYDDYCKPPWASQLSTYSLWRWDGSKYHLVESGQVESTFEEPFTIFGALLIACLLLFLVVVALLIAAWRWARIGKKVVG